MDAAAPGFRSLTAKVARVQYTAIINEKSEDGGTVYVLRSKGKDMRFLIEFDRPAPRFVLFADRKAQVFHPRSNVVQEVDLGQQKGLVEQFLLLGFGVPGKELSKSYQVAYKGDETIAGQKTSHLELTPKSEAVRQHYNKIELWIDSSGRYPVRQKLTEPSGNYWLVTYTDVQWNPDLKPEQTALKLPPNVKREYPQR